MAYTILNADGTPTGDLLAKISSSNFDPLVMGIQRYGVVSGCAATASGTGLGVSVASGVVENNGTLITVTSGTVTLSTADGTNPRIDLIEVNASGVIGKVTGTAAVEPDAPAGTAGSVRLAYVVVPAALTTLTSATVVDQRVILSTQSTSAASDSQQSIVAAEVFS